MAQTPARAKMAGGSRTVAANIIGTRYNTPSEMFSRIAQSANAIAAIIPAESHKTGVLPACRQKETMRSRGRLRRVASVLVPMHPILPGTRRFMDQGYPVERWI